MAYNFAGYELNMTEGSISASKPVDAEVHTPIGATVATVVFNSVGGLEATVNGHIGLEEATPETLLNLGGTEVAVILPDLFTGNVFVLALSVDVLAAGAGTVISATIVEV